MKTKVSFKLMGLFAGCVMMMGSCKKSGNLPAGARAVQLTAQEQMLLGKWTLRCAETYEVSGTDSAGNLLLNLIGTDNYSSACKVEFKSNAFGSDGQYHRAAGAFAGCDSTASFPWKIRQQPLKLDISPGSQYDIEQISRDSATFSAVYVKDILKLKTVYRYRRG